MILSEEDCEISAEWMAEVGFPEYVPEVSKHARSGRHLLNMSTHEYESVDHS